MCAYPTIDYERDLLTGNLVYKHRIGEVYRIRRSEKHLYYWFSNMSKDEAILWALFGCSLCAFDGAVWPCYWLHFSVIVS